MIYSFARPRLFGDPRGIDYGVDSAKEQGSFIKDWESWIASQTLIPQSFFAGLKIDSGPLKEVDREEPKALSLDSSRPGNFRTGNSSSGEDLPMTEEPTARPIVFLEDE